MPTGHHREARAPIITYIRRWILADDDALCVLSGDFNFAMLNEDRWDKDLEQHTGFRDNVEAETWNNLITSQTPLTELPQHHHTYHSTSSSSRIDRVYNTHHHADHLTSTIYLNHLPIDREASDHDALSYGRRLADSVDKPVTLPTSPLQRPDWPERVSMLYQSKLAAEHQKNLHLDAITKNNLIMEAMWEVSRNVSSTRGAGLTPLARRTP